MVTESLKTRLEQHSKWLRNEIDGKQFVAEIKEDLQGADLTGANLAYADLTDADLAGANLTGAKYEDVPIVEDIKEKILAEIEKQPESLDMSAWHGKSACGTTHCLAGWAIHLAGEAGYELEKRNRTSTAGAFIFHKSCGEVPDFYCTNNEAIQWLKAPVEA